ncbi:FadR/GntR family transcriptional regulator [Fulvivirga sp. M361]|uniref:FadR/GntR family transcriptional regulator n=1 Tax=Fulvivirga sp. M361 TaxID=2594266 RepID=UPI0021066637|nr:GntR family transcriptional regulator [Fulvivirga sp. M361]
MTKSLKLSPVVKTSLADQVEQNLMEYLKKNNFKVGDAMPKEIELAEELGVSRNVVREALSRLRMLGIVESKKRKGMVITEPDLLSSVTRLMDPSLLSDKTMKDIFELRLVLEVGMSDLLVVRKTDEDIVELKDIARKEAEDPECKHSLEVRLGYEIAFHGKLYAMTGNSTLTRFQQMLLPIFNYMMEVESHLKSEPPRGDISHMDLVTTLEKGTAAELRRNMRAHLTPHYARL